MYIYKNIQFQEYSNLSVYGINRFFYDVQNRNHMNEFLEEKNND